ncbi:SUKH-3 domain-containing protein [Kitasatospora kifunensis]|nr:SUKH-3 domain-containing protein [Kitasatospora kifunensis]
MSRFSAGVEQTLRSAGWFPGRSVEVGSWRDSMHGFPFHAAAGEFLQEFGGLRVTVAGPGISCAREPFEIDPDLAVGEEGRFAEMSNIFGRRFFPLGETARGEFFLAIDEEGVIYLLQGWVLSLGPSDTALERLVTGVAAERLRIPGDGSR